MRSDLRNVIAGFGVTFASLALPGGCSRPPPTTEEGPDPRAKISQMTPEMGAAYKDAIDSAEKSFLRLVRDQINELNTSDKDLLAARERAKDFADHGKFFAARTYLPGGILVNEFVPPKSAQQVIEGVLEERGVKLTDAK